VAVTGNGRVPIKILKLLDCISNLAGIRVYAINQGRRVGGAYETCGAGIGDSAF
jgi:hypothetical protein